MKNLLLTGFIFLFGSSAGAWAGEYWIPGTPEGSQVEFVTLEFGQQVIDNTGGMYDSKIEMALTGHTLVFSMHYSRGWDENRAMALYQSLLDAKNSASYVNVLVEEGTLAIKGLRVGVTEHPLALDGSKAGLEGRSPAAGHFRFDLLGRNLPSGQSNPKADAKVPYRAVVTR
jgi:hypothetical protein